MELSRRTIQRMILRKSGDTTVINQGSEGGGGGGGGGSVALGPLLTSLNSEAMPSAEGYLHWTGSAWAFDTPTGGDPVDLTPYALKTWVQDNFAYKSDIVNFITRTEAESEFAPISHTHANYLPLSAGSSKPLTGSLYFSGNTGINWAGGIGMLACMPESGWTGISSSQWGVGAVSAQGVIRSNANDILHYRNGTNYKIWDAYNFTPSDYLPLTGGTVESITVTNGLDADSITVGSLVNSTTLAEYLDADAMQTWGDGLYLKLTDKAGLFTQLANYDGALQITIGGTQKSLTIAYANAAGSSNTAVNADKLDNHHASDFALASALGNYLPLTGGTLSGPLRIVGNDHQNLIVNSKAETNGVKWTGIQFNHQTNKVNTFYGGIRMDEQNGALKRYTSAYTVYTVWDSGNFNPSNYLPLTGGTVQSLTVTNGLDADSITVESIVNSNTLAEYLDQDASDARYLAIGGNAVSATKLNTARTLWGQSFDGTANISGAISNTGHITPSASDTYSIGTRSNYYNTVNAKYLCVIDDKTNEDFNIRWWPADRSSGVEGYVALYAYETRMGDMCIGSTNPTYGLYFDASANKWGIGTNSPAEKLDVTGNVKAYGATLVAAEAGRAALSVDGTTATNNLTVGTTANGGTTILNGNVTIGRTGVAETIIINGYDVQLNARDIYINNGSTNDKLARVSLLSSYMPLSGDSTKSGDMIVTGKMAVGTTAFDGTAAKLQVTGNITATGSVTAGTGANKVTMGNGQIGLKTAYVSESVIFGSSNNDAAIYVSNGHVWARNSSGTSTMII